MISFSRANTAAPVTEYERKRMETVMQNSRVFRSLGIQEARDILNGARRAVATHATCEESDPLYEPGDSEDDGQGLFDKVC